MKTRQARIREQCLIDQALRMAYAKVDHEIFIGQVYAGSHEVRAEYANLIKESARKLKAIHAEEPQIDEDEQDQTERDIYNADDFYGSRPGEGMDESF